MLYGVACSIGLFIYGYKFEDANVDACTSSGGGRRGGGIPVVDSAIVVQVFVTHIIRYGCQTTHTLPLFTYPLLFFILSCGSQRIIATLSARKLRIVGQQSLFWHWSDTRRCQRLKRTACPLLCCIICHGDFLSKCVSRFLSLISGERCSSLVFFYWKGAAVVSSLS